MFVYALTGSSPLRLLSLALTVYLTEQIDIAGQLLCRVLHLILQLLLLRRTRPRTRPSGKSGPYRLKIDRRVGGLDHH